MRGHASARGAVDDVAVFDGDVVEHPLGGRARFRRRRGGESAVVVQFLYLVLKPHVPQHVGGDTDIPGAPRNHAFGDVFAAVKQRHGIALAVAHIVAGAAAAVVAAEHDQPLLVGETRACLDRLEHVTEALHRGVDPLQILRSVGVEALAVPARVRSVVEDNDRRGGVRGLQKFHEQNVVDGVADADGGPSAALGQQPDVGTPAEDLERRRERGGLAADALQHRRRGALAERGEKDALLVEHLVVFGEFPGRDGGVVGGAAGKHVGFVDRRDRPRGMVAVGPAVFLEHLPRWGIRRFHHVGARAVEHVNEHLRRGGYSERRRQNDPDKQFFHGHHPFDSIYMPLVSVNIHYRLSCFHTGSRSTT